MRKQEDFSKRGNKTGDIRWSKTNFELYNMLRSIRLNCISSASKSSKFRLQKTVQNTEYAAREGAPMAVWKRGVWELSGEVS